MNRTLAALALALAAAAAIAGNPHEHGLARLDVAVEAGRLSIALDTPLENLLGFERAPRTAAERQRVDALVTRLTAGDTLLRIDPAARCTLAAVELVSAALKLGSAPSAGDPGHADLEASYAFDCKGAAPAFVEVGLFAPFPRLQRLEVQLVTPRGQARRTLTPAAARLDLPK